MRKFILLATLSLLALSACNTAPEDPVPTETSDSVEQTDVPAVFSSDLAQACNGIATTEAAAYTEDAGTHPVILFGRDSSSDSYIEHSFVLPEAWQLDWEKAPDYQLVTCVTPTPTALAESCDFDVDGATYTLESYGADYAVELYVAQTGEKLASTTFNLAADECPSMYYFSEPVENYYPDYAQELTEFLKTYVQK